MKIKNINSLISSVKGRASHGALCSHRPARRSLGKGGSRLTLVVTVLACLAAVPNTQGVNPPPDGGYPGFNTAEGQNALLSLTTGVANTAVGWSSLKSNTDGSYNTAVGTGTLLFNVGDQSTGEGTQNTAIGTAALLSNTTGSSNTAIGVSALYFNTEGSQNTATGFSALYKNTTGNANTASGYQALGNNTTGEINTANGFAALFNNTAGDGNTACGFLALVGNTTGHANTALGTFAGDNLTTGHNNVCIGFGVAGVAGESNTIRIGDNLPNGLNQSACYIGGISMQMASQAAQPVYVGLLDGKLGTTTSSRLFKRDIKPIEKDSEAILSLKPVTFHYKSDPKNTPCFGLIAEEVAKVNPDLVVRDGKGEIYSVRYDAVNALLLNEFLKEHKKVQELEATVAQQQKKFEARLAQQEKQIGSFRADLQRVSAQLAVASPSHGGLEMIKPAPRVAASAK